MSIEIEDSLIAEAMAVIGLPAKETVEEASLRRLVRRHRQHEASRDMAGLGWDGDLDATRGGP